MRLPVVLLMAGLALSGRILELVLDVALVAFHISVLTPQPEFCLAVIENGSFPVFCAMTLAAVRSQTAFMLVVFLVTVVAVAGCFAVFLVGLVAILALDLLL